MSIEQVNNILNPFHSSHGNAYLIKQQSYIILKRVEYENMKVNKFYFFENIFFSIIFKFDKFEIFFNIFNKSKKTNLK